MCASPKQTCGGRSGNRGIQKTNTEWQEPSSPIRGAVVWIGGVSFRCFLSLFPCYLAPDTEKCCSNEPWSTEEIADKGQRTHGFDVKQQSTDSENWRDKPQPKSQTGPWVAYTQDPIQIGLQKTWKSHWHWYHSPQKEGENLRSEPKWVDCLLKQNYQHSPLYWHKTKNLVT